MKRNLIIAFWVMTSSLMAQKNIEKTISFIGKQSVDMNIQIADSISIETWNRPEIYVSAVINMNEAADNEAYETMFDESGSNVLIKAAFKKDYLNKKRCCCDGFITWKVIIPDNTPLTVETINGNITLNGKTSSVRAKSISGFIDWKISPGMKADLEMKTITGTMYSDLDFGNRKSNNGIPQFIKESLNGGGFPVQIETISGDIFCRASK